MKKKLHISLNNACIILLLMIVYCQIGLGQIQDSINTKGIKLPKKSVVRGTVRAVIVGISDYENEGIPDLQYAHIDAEKFREYLQSTPGYGLNSDHIKTLLNEEATGGNIHKALYWLIKESQENDVCILYFSGHGDVETIYPDEPGHFLVYDSPSSLYQINSLRLDDLKRITRTLTEQNRAKVLIITDACRSGKLAGSEVSGSQSTSAALAQQFSSEIKIMSCQPNEYAVEGPQWGGGRGLFSYHLIEGLIGLADQNQDKHINLKEIQRYLEDRFDEDLTTHSQTPLVVGNRSDDIALVDEIQLISLKTKKNIKDNSTSLLAEATPTKKSNENETMVKFYEAINQKILLKLEEANDQKSAETYYEIIANIPELQSKVPLIKGDFIAALQDEAQVAINKYLSVDYDEMMKRFQYKNEDYLKYPKYLDKAANLLTESHYLFPQVKAKAIYFDVVGQRLKLEQEEAVSSAFEKLEDPLIKAMTYDPNAPHIWNELGLIYLKQNKYEQAQTYLNKATTKSPTWVIPYHNKIYLALQQDQLDEAISIGQMAIELNPDYMPSYALIADAFYLKGHIQKSIDYDRIVVHNFKNDLCYYKSRLGEKHFKLRNLDSADYYFQLAIDCDNNYWEAYLNKAAVLIQKKEIPQAIAFLHNTIDQFEPHAPLYDKLGNAYLENREFDKAEKYYLKSISIDSLSASNQLLGLAYITNGEPAKSIPYFQYHLQHINPKDAWSHFDLACAYASTEDLTKFKDSMEQAIANGFKSLTEFTESTLLDTISNTKEYQMIKAQLLK